MMASHNLFPGLKIFIAMIYDITRHTNSGRYGCGNRYRVGGKDNVIGQTNVLERQSPFVLTVNIKHGDSDLTRNSAYNIVEKLLFHKDETTAR